MRHPILDKLTRHNNTLFVSEAKSKDVSLEDHVPQAVCEMYACAKKLGLVALPLNSILLSYLTGSSGRPSFVEH